MDYKIDIVSKSGLRCEVGKIKAMELNGEDAYINIITHFEPISLPVFLLELRKKPSVEYLSNIAYYGQQGGIVVKLKSGVTHEQIVADIMQAMEDSKSTEQIQF